MKIAILGAMVEEIQPILKQLSSYTQMQHGNNTYYFASYQSHELVIAHSRVGKVFSSMTASIMIEKFAAQMLIFTGVAGGVSPSMQVGDLMIARQTLQHDFDITPFGRKKGELSDGRIAIDTDRGLRKIADKLAKEQQLVLKKGIIATGDQFINSNNDKQNLLDVFKADAVEMEGGSVNMVCHELQVPCLILRAISDTADGDAVDDFPDFLNMAAKRSANFILALIAKL